MQFPNWLLKLLGIIGAVLLIVLTINQLYVVVDKSKNLDDKHVVTISAQGKVTAVPDLATMSASVVTDADTAANAQNQNTQKMNKVIAYIKSQGVDSKDIETSSYNIYPKYDYNKVGSPSINGYTANQTITVKVHDLTIVGKLLDGVTQNGVNQIQNVSYSFDDPDKFRQQAREQALANAKDKAQRLAAAAGVQLGKLISFNEDQTGYPMPIYDRAAMPMATGLGGGGATPVQTEPGSQEITAQITVTYSLK